MTADEWPEIRLFNCTVLGGSACSSPTGALVHLTFEHSSLAIHTQDFCGVKQILYPEIASIAITGPGSVTTGGGFIGGGFGVAGALEGMAMAAIVNAITTRTKIHTILEFITHHGELFLHYGDMEPGALRIALSPVFERLRELDPSWQSERMNRLSTLRDRGILTDEQFERLGRQLTIVARPVIDTAPSRPLLSEHDKERLSRGLCPRCDAYNVVDKQGNTQKCALCGAVYPVV